MSEADRPLRESPPLTPREIIPGPRGHRHRQLRTILAGVKRSGVPGFEVRELAEEVRPPT